MLPVGADACGFTSPNADVVVDDAPNMELVLVATAEAPNTGDAPKPLAVGATEAVPLLAVPKAGGFTELAAPNAGT